MLIKFACKCGKTLQADAKYAGRNAKCSNCGASISVPIPERARTSSPASAFPAPPPPTAAAPQGVSRPSVAPLKATPLHSAALPAQAQPVVPPPLDEGRAVRETFSDSLSVPQPDPLASLSSLTDESTRSTGASRRRVPPNNGVPVLVRVFGLIIMGLHGVVGGLTLAGLIIWLLYVLAEGENLSAGSLVMLLGFFCLLFVPICGVHLVMLRLGNGLRHGQRSAVWGLLIVGVLCAGTAILFFSLSEGSTASRWAIAIPALYAGAVCLPPVVAAFKAWKEFS